MRKILHYNTYVLHFGINNLINEIKLYCRYNTIIILISFDYLFIRMYSTLDVLRKFYLKLFCKFTFCLVYFLY